MSRLRTGGVNGLRRMQHAGPQQRQHNHSRNDAVDDEGVRKRIRTFAGSATYEHARGSSEADVAGCEVAQVVREAPETGADVAPDDAAVLGQALRVEVQGGRSGPARQGGFCGAAGQSRGWTAFSHGSFGIEAPGKRPNASVGGSVKACVGRSSRW